ncbi:MAG: TIGR02206 family membrane protein [Eubacteriales bacterium]
MFNEKYSTGLEMFSVTHLIVIAVCIVLLACTVIFRKRFASPKADKVFRFTLASILLIFEITFHIWTAVSGGYSWNMFPLFGLCATTNLLTIIALFTNNRKIVETTVYWGLCGAFFSLIFVDITYMPPHFRFFHYFLVHFGFALGGLYFVITGKIRPTRKGVNRSCIILLAHSLLIYVLDLIFDKNWLYMREPAIDGLPDFLSGPLYTVLWILLIAGMINMWYGILKLSNYIGAKISSRRAPVQSD